MPGLSSFGPPIVSARTALKIVGGLAVLLAVYWLSSLEALSRLLDPERIGVQLNLAGPLLAPLLLMAAMALAVVISPLPSLPLDAAAGVAFGPWLGTLYAALGALAGALAAFGVARLLGRELVERVAGGHINFCRACSDRLLARVVFLSRLLPFVSFDVISYGAGLTNMSATRFGLATFFGMLPVTFAAVYFGSLIAFSRATVLLIGAVLVAVFLLLPGWIERNDLFGLRRYFADHLDTPSEGRD